MQNTTLKYEPYGKRHLLPGAMPFFIGTLLYLTALTPVLPQIVRVPALVVAFLVIVATTALLSLMAVSLQQTKIARWRLVLPPTLLVTGAFLFHLLVGTPLARFATVTAVMLLLFGFLIRLDSLKETADAARDSVLRFGRITTLVGVFFLYVFGFAIREFMSMPAVLTAFVLGLILIVVSYEALLQAEDIEPRLRKLTAVALSLLAAELFIGLSFLPTPFLVNAVVLLVAYFACTRASVRILHGDLGTRELRLGLLAAAIMVVLVLATARWT